MKSAKNISPKLKGSTINTYFIYAVLGLIVSFGACLFMYWQYLNQTKTQYFNTLASVAHMIERQYPVLYDIDRLKQAEGSGIDDVEEWIWDTAQEFFEITEAFDLAYIYYIERTESGYISLLDSHIRRDLDPEMLGGPVWLKTEDVPAGVNEAWDSQELTFSPYPSVEEWGVLVSALLPIVKDGQTIGLLGVDYDISQTTSLESRLRVILLISLALIFGSAGLGAVIVVINTRSLSQQARVLQANLARETAMQDHLKFGLFLLNNEYEIHEAHSKALEGILSISDLKGKNFLDIFASSLKSTELDGLADYFDMIFKKAYDRELLESVNPINEISYFVSETGEIKHLRSTFTLVEWGTGEGYILGTLEDITVEKQLEKQLKEIEGQKELEMRSLFQVIQLNPQILLDFIEEAEHEFDAINEILKSKDKFDSGILVDMYQSIHAIKSNALILNLEDFSSRLHKFETSISNIQEKHMDFVSLDDFLGLIFELNEVLKEKDQLKSAVSRIENFKTQSGEQEKQQKYILTETLAQICAKTAASQQKKARLEVNIIDDAALKYGPRKEIKDLFTQLIRNAVYHGIESPVDRNASGKKDEGVIRISLKLIDRQIVMKVADDGRGIDCGLIKQTAIANNMLDKAANADDKNSLIKLLFLPGFTTQKTSDMHAGRGIGLSLVKDRVKHLHGTIKINTELNKGTVFTISFPSVMARNENA